MCDASEEKKDKTPRSVSCRLSEDERTALPIIAKWLHYESVSDLVRDALDDKVGDIWGKATEFIRDTPPLYAGRKGRKPNSFYGN